MVVIHIFYTMVRSLELFLKSGIQVVYTATSSTTDKIMHVPISPLDAKETVHYNMLGNYYHKYQNWLTGIY